MHAAGGATALPPPDVCADPHCVEAAQRAWGHAACTHPTYPSRADPVRWVGEVDMRAPTAAILFDEVCAEPFSAVCRPFYKQKLHHLLCDPPPRP